MVIMVWMLIGKSDKIGQDENQKKVELQSDSERGKLIANVNDYLWLQF